MFNIFRLYDDTSINTEEKDGNNGLNPQGFVYNYTTNGVQKESRYLFKLDIDNIIDNIAGVYTDYTASLTFFSSDITFKHNSSDIHFSIYPLSESYQSGTGYINDINVGASWNQKDTENNWVTTGSTYLGDIEFSSSINNQFNLEFDLFPIIDAYISGSFDNNGFVLLTSDEIYKFAFYGVDSDSSFNPIIVLKNDTVTNNVESASVYTSSYVNDISIYKLAHKTSYTIGENVIIPFSFEHVFKPREFNYTLTDYYIENVRYDILDGNSDNILVADVLCDINKVNVINFNTDSFKEGDYKIHIKYSSLGYNYIDRTTKIGIHGSQNNYRY